MFFRRRSLSTSNCWLLLLLLLVLTDDERVLVHIVQLILIVLIVLIDQLFWGPCMHSGQNNGDIDMTKLLGRTCSRTTTKITRADIYI